MREIERALDLQLEPDPAPQKKPEAGPGTRDAGTPSE
jgi:hypothetical protein